VLRLLHSGAATQAPAAIVDVTYTGTVTDDYDQTGIFGSVGDSGGYVGLTYIANYVLNVPNGIPESSSAPDALQGYHGGTVYGAGVASPVISATVTVGSVTVSVPTYYDSRVYSAQYVGGFGAQFHQAGGCCDSENLDISKSQIQAFNGSIPYTLTGSFTYVVADNAGAFGSQSYEYAVHDSNTGLNTGDTLIQADVTSVVVQKFPSFCGASSRREFLNQAH
jgi:hypothetical protein